MLNARYLNGMIISSQFTSVEFIQVLALSGPIVDIDQNRRKIIISYSIGQLNTDVTSSLVEIINTEEINLLGIYLLYPIIEINGIQFIRNLEKVTLRQYHLDAQKLTQNTIIEDDSQLYILILHSDPILTAEQYVEFINTNSSYVRCRLWDLSKFKISNIFYYIMDKGEVVDITDTNILGTTKEYVINDAMCVASFIRTLEQTYPDIHFYSHTSESDTEKETFVKYKSYLPDATSPKFHSRVLDHPIYGRFWQTTIKIELEYQSFNLPKLIKFRDDYKAGKAFNNVKQFKVMLGEEEFSFSTFWDRTSIPDMYNTVGSLDDSQRKLFTIPIQVELIVLLVERKITYPTIIDGILTIRNLTYE